MEGLQRSQVSFRRQGSSGMVWDDKFLSAEIEKVRLEKEAEAAAAGGGEDNRKDDNNKEKKSPELKRSRSDGGHGGSKQTTYRTVKVADAEDPPSPKVAACGFCSVFGKAAAKDNKHKQKKSSGKK